MRNQGPEGDQLADILEFPEAAKRLLAMMQAREQAPTPNPNPRLGRANEVCPRVIPAVWPL